MRRTVAKLVLAAAIAGVAGLPGVFPSIGQGQVDPAPTTQPAGEKTAVPVKMVVLYSSGVGYFQHSGTVNGNADTELRFKSGQINDILKSLVLEDKGGNVAAVTYPSQDPLDKTLRSFQIDIGGNPALDQLLTQLRGAKVTLVLSTEKVSGSILGVEKRTKPAGENKTYEVPVVNVISGATIRAVELTDVRDIQLENPTLQDELEKALAAVASARDKDKKPVTIHFRGTGQRQVLLGYVIETPVWKASYRLLLGDANGEKAQQAASPAAGAGQAAGASIQGWAIVENQTDNDWNDVQLSLVSGRPISFVEDLYQPLYVPRPVVKPELFASLMPQTYEGGQVVPMNMPAKAGEQTLGRGMKMQQQAMQSQQMRFYGPVGGAASSADEADKDDKAQLMDAGRIASVASAANLGELFQYTVPSVSLPRQTSAMIPIVSDPIDVQPVSIYNQDVLARHPLNGARMKNTTGKHLLAGPVTVLEGSTYAGDAQINDVPPGEQRLISYGIDLKMLVDVKNPDSSDEVLTGKIVKGVLQMTHKYIQSTEYDIENKSGGEKTLVIEQRILDKPWELIDTAAPVETTDRYYRFENKIGAGKQTKFVVKMQAVQDQVFALLDTDADGIVVFAHNGQIPKDVQQALEKAAEMKRDVAETQQRIDQDSAAEAAIAQDQKRINETVKNIGQNTPLYGRLLGELNDQETELDKLKKEKKDLLGQKNDQQKKLEDFVGGLNVG